MGCCFAKQTQQALSNDNGSGDLDEIYYVNVDIVVDAEGEQLLNNDSKEHEKKCLNDPFYAYQNEYVQQQRTWNYILQLINKLDEKTVDKQTKQTELLYKICENILENPCNTKYQQMLFDKMKKYEICLDIMQNAGFETSKNGQLLVFTKNNYNMRLLNNIYEKLKSNSTKKIQFPSIKISKKQKSEIISIDDLSKHYVFDPELYFVDKVHRFEDWIIVQDHIDLIAEYYHFYGKSHDKRSTLSASKYTSLQKDVYVFYEDAKIDYDIEIISKTERGQYILDLLVYSCIIQQIIKSIQQNRDKNSKIKKIIFEEWRVLGYSLKGRENGHCKDEGDGINKICIYIDKQCDIDILNTLIHEITHIEIEGHQKDFISLQSELAHTVYKALSVDT